MGDYIDSPMCAMGFRLHKGIITSFDVPGSIQTNGIDINNFGVIGGTFLDSNNAQHSYVLNNGAFANEVPSALPC